jgi:hypothetical protein
MVDVLNTASGVIHFYSGYLEMPMSVWDNLYKSQLLPAFFLDFVSMIWPTDHWRKVEEYLIISNELHMGLMAIKSHVRSWVTKVKEENLLGHHIWRLWHMIELLWVIQPTRSKSITHAEILYFMTVIVGSSGSIKSGSKSRQRISSLRFHFREGNLIRQRFSLGLMAKNAAEHDVIYR